MEPTNGMAGGAEPSMNTQSTSGQGSESLGLVDRGKERVRTSVDDGKARVARTLSSVASSLKDSSASMRDGDAAAVGGVVERVADQIDRAANYLERSEVDEIVSGVERFAKRNPALFIGAAFAVGVLGARFLKSSRPGLSSLEGSGAAGFIEREVPTSRPIGSADLASGTTGTGTVTGANDRSAGLE